MSTKRGAVGRGARAFRVFLVSYLAIFLLPFLASTVFFNRVLSVMREQEIESRLSRLARARDEVERQMAEVESFAIQLALRPKIATVLLLDRPLEGSSVYKVRDAWLDLSTATYRTELVRSFLVYFRDTRLLMSQESVATRLELFDTSCFSYDGLSFLEWQRRDHAAWRDGALLPSATVTLGREQLNALTYTRTLPIGSPGPGKGQVIVFVDSDAILRLLGAGEGDGGFCYAVDGAGRILTSLPAACPDPPGVPTRFDSPSGRITRRLDGRSMVYLHATIAARAVTLVTAVSEAATVARAARMRAIVIAVSAAVLAVGLGAAIVLAWWNNRVPRSLLARLTAYLGDDPPGTTNEYRLIEGGIQRLIVRDREVKDTLARQAPVIRQAFFDRLSSGGFHSRGELDVLAAFAGVRLDGPSHCALLARVAGYGGGRNRDTLEAVHLSRAMVRETLGQDSDLPACLHDAGSDNLGLLVAGAGSAGCVDRAEQMADLARRACRDRLGVRLEIAGGSPVDDPLLLYHSYFEARHALCRLDPRASADHGVAWFVDLPEDGASFWYPMDVESRMASLAHAGDVAAVDELLDRIYRENFVGRSLAPEMAQALLAELAGTGIKLGCSAAGASVSGVADARFLLPRPGDGGPDSDPRRRFDSLRESYRTYCRLMDRRKQSHNEALVAGILAHIDACFTDPNVCLRSVAERFGLNEIYLSRFFKEQTGANFHRHLEGLRIRRAIELLEGTELSINEIARRVGYVGQGTFRKALRRAAGESPREMRLRLRLRSEAPVVDS